MTDENKISLWTRGIKKATARTNLFYAVGSSYLYPNAAPATAFVYQHNRLARAKMGEKSQTHTQTCAVFIERQSEVLHFQTTHANRMTNTNLLKPQCI